MSAPRRGASATGIDPSPAMLWLAGDFPIWPRGLGQDWGCAHVEGGIVQPIGNGT